MTDACLLIGDIGGTNARFALAEPDSAGFRDLLTLPTAEYETAELAIQDYLQQKKIRQPRVVCLAVAGPVVDNSVRFTNNHWSIEADSLRRSFGNARISLLNDFEAIAYAIPDLRADDLASIGTRAVDLRSPERRTIAVLGAGTGLGVAGMVMAGEQQTAIVGEGGHLGFAPESHLQFEVLRVLRERFERVSDERVISGPGLENLYWAVGKVHGENRPKLKPRQIFQAARSEGDVIAATTLQLFFEVLGQVAGNVALTLGAWQGVLIAGGIVCRYPDLLKASSFRSGFEHKGRYRSLMEATPTALITAPQPGLLGASHYARGIYQNIQADKRNLSIVR